ncbi:hypothetical protein ACIA8C_18410 [Nocardia sp. NPDC051321]|uniref:hypothetical protein n=1 Tax=Nocardia sp. NPDC051321 TaxID=3364323 RepID=UPI0037996B47
MFAGFALLITGTVAAGLFLVAVGLALPIRAIVAVVAALALLSGGATILIRAYHHRGGLLDPDPTRKEVQEYKTDYRR